MRSFCVGEKRNSPAPRRQEEDPNVPNSICQSRYINGTGDFLKFALKVLEFPGTRSRGSSRISGYRACGAIAATAPECQLRPSLLTRNPSFPRFWSTQRFRQVVVGGW